MTELEQINEKLDRLLEIFQPKKETSISNSLDEVRKFDNDRMPFTSDFRLKEGEFCDGWDYLILNNKSFGFYNKKAYLKALEEWAKRKANQ